MKHPYCVTVLPSGVLVTSLFNDGRLSINFAEHVILEDLECSPMVELANLISEKIDDPDCMLSIKGDNKVFLTTRYGFNIDGFVCLNNVELVNPYIINSNLENVRFGNKEQIKQTRFLYSSFNNVGIYSGSETIHDLDVRFSSASNTLIKLPGDNRDGTMSIRYELLQEIGKEVYDRLPEVDKEFLCRP